MKSFGAPPQYLGTVGRYPRGGVWASGDVARDAWTEGQAMTPLINRAVGGITHNFEAAGDFTLNNSASVGSTNANTAIGATNALQLSAASSQSATMANNRLTVPASTAFTIDGWARLTTLGSARNILVFDAGTNNGWYIVTTSGNAVNFFNNGSGVVSPTITVSVNTWFHYMMVSDGSTFSLFVDGARSATASYSSKIGNTAVGTLRAGDATANPAATYWNGQIGGLRVLIGQAIVDPSKLTVPVPTTLFL